MKVVSVTFAFEASYMWLPLFFGRVLLAQIPFVIQTIKATCQVTDRRLSERPLHDTFELN